MRKSPIILLFFLFTGLSLCGQTYLEKKEFSQIIRTYARKDYKNACRQFKAFKEKYPSSYYLPDVYLYLGQLEENYYLAVVTLKDLINKYPEYKRMDEALYRLAKLYFLHSNYTESIRYFSRIREEFPKSHYHYGSAYYLGLAHLIRTDHTKARLYFDEVLALNKKENFHVLALAGKAHSFYETGEYAKSVDLFKQALALKNAEHEAALYLGLGNSFLKMKDYGKAYYYYKKVVREFAGSSEYELALEKIDTMKKSKTILDKIRLDIEKKPVPSAAEPAKEFFTVQAASVKDKRLANDLRIKLKSHRFDPFLLTAETKEGTFFRTCVGKFSSAAEAQKTKTEIDRRFKLDSVIVKIPR